MWAPSSRVLSVYMWCIISVASSPDQQPPPASNLELNGLFLAVLEASQEETRLRQMTLWLYPVKKITTIRAVTARATLRTFKDVAPKKMRIINFVTQLMFLRRGNQMTLPSKIFIFNSNN